jgi:hypothetical protein
MMVSDLIETKRLPRPHPASMRPPRAGSAAPPGRRLAGASADAREQGNGFFDGPLLLCASAR